MNGMKRRWWGWRQGDGQSQTPQGMTDMPCRLPSASKPERVSLATSGQLNNHMLSVYDGQGSEGPRPHGRRKDKFTMTVDYNNNYNKHQINIIRKVQRNLFLTWTGYLGKQKWENKWGKIHALNQYYWSTKHCAVGIHSWTKIKQEDFPSGPVAKTACSQCRGLGFCPWSGN